MDEYESISIEDILVEFKTNPKKGLSTDDVNERLEKYGHNLHLKETDHLWKKLFSFFWGPIPWMIEIAAILCFILERWPDFFAILTLLLINAAVGFIQEYQASQAIRALKQNLALRTSVLRNGEWQTIEAKNLVPGDVVSIKLGNVIPADIKLIDGEYLSVDESMLTEESEPITKKIGDVIYSGSVVLMGEMIGIVIKTASGKTVKIIPLVDRKSHFEQAFLQMGNVLIAATLLICSIILIISFYRLEIEHFTNESVGKIIIFFLVLVIAGIPIASPALFSVAMAMGARKLARMKAIVSRLSSIELLSSMDILCCDKTGTLTQNQLTVSGTLILEGKDENEILLIAALASNKNNLSPIDDAIFRKIKADALKNYTIEKHIPFDSIHKRAESTVRSSDQTVFKALKGAPQVILQLSSIDKDLKIKVLQGVESFAKKGFRTIGVAKCDPEQKWHYLGLIALLDPLRSDSQETIKEIQNMGLEIKIITGDHESIAHELSHSLGLGTKILSVDKLYHENISDVMREELIVTANGFAEVYPEHKYEIVKTLQKNNYVVGMTGDSVNDCHALKQADIGIAVSNSTDAARQAADLILTEPGLGVIRQAITESRKTFGRMKSYMLYRMSETFRLLLFLLIATFMFPEHPLTANMIILIALLNDIPIMMIAHDNMRPHSHPVDWNIKELITISIGFSIVGIASTFGLFWIGEKIWFANVTDLHLRYSYLQTLSFMSILCSGNLTIFLTRNIGPIWQRPFPEWKFTISTIISLVIGSVISAYGLYSTDFVGLGWKYVLLAWAYILAWFVLTMIIKNFLYKIIGYKETQFQRFFHTAEKPLR